MPPPTLPGYGRRVLGSDPLWWYHRQKFYSAIRLFGPWRKHRGGKNLLSLVFYKFWGYIWDLIEPNSTEASSFSRGHPENRVAISLGQHRNIRRRSVNASLSVSTQPAVTKIVPHARAATRSVARLIKTTAVRTRKTTVNS